MTRTLEQVLSEARADALVLKRHGLAAHADSLARLCDQVATAAEPYLRFISEAEASMRAGKSARWVQSRYAELEREGYARMNSGHRQYRECAIPRRSDTAGAYEAGRAAVRRGA